ncbi:hypothetical protein GOP47_0002301 [Adiantum capillus-veneris]|uniref:Uncharacterized protein n=1 Tax=Adiantum capillus-veneris TaxID=13818 RepID=A0A9D4VAD2_ADICA|nr:hypothetical protein GOP47_0002301 [Adiantum capillus-veneris]
MDGFLSTRGQKSATVLQSLGHQYNGAPQNSLLLQSLGVYPLAKKSRPSNGISSMEALGSSVHVPPYFNLGPLCCFTSPWWPALPYSALQGHSKAARHLLFQAMALGGFLLPCSPKQ